MLNHMTTIGYNISIMLALVPLIMTFKPSNILVNDHLKECIFL